MQLVSTNCAWRKKMLSGAVGLMAGLGLLAFAPGSRAQVNYSETNVTVNTIGGGPLDVCGPYLADTDGGTFDYSQFDGPVSMALNSQGTLFIADMTNNAVRAVTQVGDDANSLTSTVLTNMSFVNGVAMDAADSLYVITQGDRSLRKYLKSGNLLFTYVLPAAPTALAVARDAATNIFIAFADHSLVRFTQNGSAIVTNTTIVTNAFKWNPSGLAWRADGLLAVSDLLNNAIYTVTGTNNSTPVIYTGNTNSASTNGGVGWVDGPPAFARFNQPYGLAWSADNQLVVADRGNNAVRRIDASGVTSTIYGVNSNLWYATDCQDEIYAGWIDGPANSSSTNATGNLPNSVLISPGGDIFVTELFYGLLRSVANVGLLPNGTTNSVTGTNTTPTNVVVVPPPLFGPDSGYFPECVTISVTNSAPYVFYTSDGTTPTTNSPELALTNNIIDGEYEGSFQWCNSQHDLSFLQIIGFNGTNTSVVVTGQTITVNQVGFSSGKKAGIGSTAVIPLVITLRSNQVLESVQFRVEVTPIAPNTTALSSLVVLPISTNDFVPFIGASAGNAPVNYQTLPYSIPGGGMGLAVLASGSSSGFFVQNFAVPLLLAVQIPANALPGQTYQLAVLNPTGTSDDAQATVNLATMPDQTLTVADLVYFAGDSSPSSGYSAGEFGNGSLDNSDVNNALMASVGIHVPFPFTDAYNAMDVYPETPGPNGEIGDGFITFLDWQHILFRSLGLETNNWIRYWTNGGVLAHQQISWSPGQTVPIGVTPSRLSQANLGKKATLSLDPTGVWVREAAINAGTVANQLPGSTCSIPIYMKVRAGFSLAGLQFHATVVPSGGAPTPSQIQFTPAAGLPAPASYKGLSSNDLVCAWSLFDPFTPPLRGSNLIGSISFVVPTSAQTGQSYTVQFGGVDGAPDLNTFYQLESVPGAAWVKSVALTPPQITSDEWRIYYFGSTTNSLAADNADPDGDGIPNWEEYLAGTNPTNALSNLQFTGAGIQAATPQNVNLSWLTSAGRTYILESSLTLGNNNWTPVSTNIGDGNAFQISITSHPGNARFYRLRLQP